MLGGGSKVALSGSPLVVLAWPSPPRPAADVPWKCHRPTSRPLRGLVSERSVHSTSHDMWVILRALSILAFGLLLEVL
jgi:hypothetical protein